MASRRRTEYRCPRGLEVQTVIFPRGAWGASEARAWLRKHDFTQAKIDTTSGSYRFRQRPPSAFVRGSFRTITLGDEVKAVVGCPKERVGSRQSSVKRAVSGQPSAFSKKKSKRKKSRRDAPYDLSPSGREFMRRYGRNLNSAAARREWEALSRFDRAAIRFLVEDSQTV